MRAIGVIPARLAATRLPNKPLLDIAGKPMIQWVWERSAAARMLDEVVVATPDPEIVSACRAFGAEGVLTSPDHETGTDRVAEVVRGREADIAVNIQGDEPLTHPDALDALVEGLIGQEDAALASLMFALGEQDDVDDPNLVKAVVDRNGFALYFSRAGIPYRRNPVPVRRYGHMGIYAWRRARLLEFTGLPRVDLEQAESLEQLRALDAGWKIYMVLTEHRPIGVDTPEDLERARRALQGSG